MEKPKSSVEKGRKSRLRNYGAFLVPSTCLSHFFPGDGGRLSQISPGKHVTHSGEGRNLSYTGNKIYEAKKKKKIHQSCELISTCLYTAFWSYPALGTINITCQELGTNRARIYLIPTSLRAWSSASITPAKIVESILFQGNWKLKF